MQNSAYKRGAIAAELWLKLTRSARVANEVCVSWVLRQGLRGSRANNVKNHAKSLINCLY